MAKHLIFIVLFFLASCGGGGGGGSSPPPPSNNPPTITPIAAQSMIEGELLSITASASDSDGTVASYLWQQTGGAVVQMQGVNTNRVILTAPAVTADSSVSLRLIVTDNGGASASLDLNVSIKNAAFSATPHRVNFLPDQDLTTFFTFFDQHNLNRIDLVVAPDEWNAFLAELNRDVLSDTYFKAEVSITTAGRKETIPEVGFRLRGNAASRRLPQTDAGFHPVHFKLKFNETFALAPDSLPYLEREERRYANLRSLNLKSRRPGYDDSQIREIYSYDLFNQAGLKAPLTTSAHLYLTVGATVIDYGIYTAIEPIDKSFLRKRYGDVNNEGNLYKCLWQAGGPATLALKHPAVAFESWIGVSDGLGFTPSYDLKTNESTRNFNDLTDFISQLNALDGAALKTYLDANFEVDKFLQVLAMNVLIGMPDDYWAMGNNYYLYFNNGGKLEFFPYDYDSAFGGGWKPFSAATVDIYTWHSLSGELSGDSYYNGHPLADKIMAIEAYRSVYSGHLARFIASNGNFNYPAYSQRFDLLKGLYDPDGDGRLTSDLIDNVTVMQNEEQAYFDSKIASVKAQLGL